MIDYKPTPRQAMFHASDADEVLYGGAAGGGKSCAVVMEALFRCLEHPGTTAYLFRRTYPQLRDTLVKEALHWYPRGLYEFNRSAMEMRLVNGSKVLFRHLNHPSDMYGYQGAEIQWLFMDELTHFTSEEYNYLKTRLRAPKRMGVRPVARCTSNPGGVGHAWVKAYFVDAGEGERMVEETSETLGQTRTLRIAFIPAKAKDNPHLTRDYIFELERKPPKLRDALLHGSWDAFEGQVFVEWDAGVHVVKPFDVPAHWPRYRSFDFGYAKPFSVGWWAVDDDGGVWRIAEWYGWTGSPNEGAKLTPVEIAQGIARRERLHSPGVKVRGVADPSIWDASRGVSIAEQMAKEGVFFEPGDNDRMAGKMQLHQRLAVDGNGASSLRVFESCAQFIRTIPALPYDEKRLEDVDSDAEDHVYDETRYFLMARPMKGKPQAERKRRELDPLGTMMQAR